MPKVTVMEYAPVRILSSLTETLIAEGPMDDRYAWTTYVDEIPIGSEVTFKVEGLGTIDCANWDAQWAEGRVGDKIAPDGFEVEDVSCTGGFLQGGDGICRTKYVGTGNTQTQVIGVVAIIGISIGIAVLLGAIAGLWGVVTGKLGKWLGQIGNIAMWTAVGIASVAVLVLGYKALSNRGPPRYDYPYGPSPGQWTSSEEFYSSPY